MSRAAVLIQRVALGGTRRHMARLARLGITWPRGQGRYMDKLRQATARCALDRLGATCSHDLLACGLIDDDYLKNTQGDAFDPLCALLMQPVCPRRVLLALETTDAGGGHERTRRMGVVGVRMVQAAGRMLGEYTTDADEDRKSWLDLIDQLIARGMTREARLPYAPVGLLSVCNDAGIAQGLLDRGFAANGPEGLLPPLSLCQDPGVVEVLIRAGADCLVPSMNFIDDPVAMFGYIEREDTRVFARWCRLDMDVARELLAASNMGRATNQDIEDAIISLHDNSPSSGDEVSDLFHLLCREVGVARMETIMGPEDGLQRRTILGNPGMTRGYLRARAEASRDRMTERTPDGPCDTGRIGRL